MAVTLAQVRAMLDAEEPNYAALARLGPQILPHLQTLIASGDEYFATKAASLASRINDERATAVLRDAAKHASPRVRLAVAGAIKNVARPAAAGVLMALLDDRDPGVRKTALKAAWSRYYEPLTGGFADTYAPGVANENRTWLDCPLNAAGTACSGVVLATTNDGIAQDSEIGPGSPTFGLAAERNFDPAIKRDRKSVV